MGQRLLLVDSDRSFLKEHQVSLEAAFDLEVAGSPEGVLQRLESGNYAAVLICVEVADNKGYALCSSLRKNSKLDRVKTALISAKATEEEYRRHQSLKGRADLYLHKPIAPSALVAALAPLVPGRTLDPDNPLGELVDTELGDDWLDGLKGPLDNQAPASGTRPFSLAQPAQPSVSATVPPDTGRVRLLEEQIAGLQEELRNKDQRLAAAEQRLAAGDQGLVEAEQRLAEVVQRLAAADKRLAESDKRAQVAESEAQQALRQLNSVTLNLDELERSNRESENLKTRLAETEAALRGLEETRGREGESLETLKAQLREALTERTELIHQVETLNKQVGEKSQRAIELLKDRDRLLRETMELEPFRAKAKSLEGTLAEKDAQIAAKAQEVEAAVEAQGQLNASLEELVQRHASLEGVHQSALLEVAGYKEKIHAGQLELAGLEATMRGQGRDLAELGARLRQRESELAASQALVLERDQQLLSLQETLQHHQGEMTQLSTQLGSVSQELNEVRIQHEGERLELMNGLDQKEREINRLNRALSDQQEAHAALEREKQAIHGQLSEHRDRLQNLDGLLQEVQDKLRRGSDLARG